MTKIDWPQISVRIRTFSVSLLARLRNFTHRLTALLSRVFTWKRVRFCLIVFAVLLLIFGGLQIAGRRINAKAWKQFSQELRQNSDISALDKKIKEFEKKYKREFPKGTFLVIDTARNILTLKNGAETIHQAQISCGSGNVLDDPAGNRSWIFDTPRGEFTVQYKLRDPVWIKPDWAFIEEGTPIPKSQTERVETGVLGDYALGFGNGFFIHGTLYTRLLGRNVTHGCVRVGDKDLELIYKKVALGSRIFIF